MDIKALMQRIHDAANDEERERIQEEIVSGFSSLSEEEKKVVRKDFIDGMDAKIEEGKRLIEKVDIELAISEVSKYLSLSRISANYFGKSKEWLYQRIKGYMINGKPASFNESERKKLAEALEDISRMAHETSLKIS
jgi:hypothetical protein